MQDNREITNEEVQKASEIINNLLSYYNSKVVGLAKTIADRVMIEVVNASS